MKFWKLAFAIAGAAVALPQSGCAASPAATQAWVKKYVAEHGGSSGGGSAQDMVSAFTSVIDGTNVTIEIHYAAAGKPALRVERSDNPDLPAGVCFAKTANGLYQNLTNRHCDAICVMGMEDGVWLTQDASGRWTTNVRYRVGASFSVDGAEYRGFRSGGSFPCANVADTNSVIILVPHSLTAEERAATLTPPPAVSLLSLFVGQAFAGWTPGEWDYTKELVREDDDHRYYRKRRHYYFSSSSDVGGIDHVTIWINSEYMELEVPSDTFPRLPDDESDFCGFSGLGDSGGDIRTTLQTAIASALKSQMGWQDRQADLFAERIMGAQGDAISADVDRRLDAMKDDIGSGAPESCPEEDEYPEDKESCDPEGDQTGEPGGGDGGGGDGGDGGGGDGGGGGHRHPQASDGSYCGHWICEVCGKQIKYSDAPKSHRWGNRDGHCARCMNSYLGAQCAATSEDPNNHIFNGEGDAAGCICANGKHWPHRTPQASGEYAYDDTYHWRPFTCTTCNYSTQEMKEPHVGDEPLTYDCTESHCNVLGRCVCGYDCKVEEHDDHVRGELTSVKVCPDDGSKHRKWYACKRSGRPDMVGEVPEPHAKVFSQGYEDLGDGTHARAILCRDNCGWDGEWDTPSKHVAGEPLSPAEYAIHSTSGHALKAVCSAKGCGAILEMMPIDPHSYGDLVLSGSWGDSDYRQCEVCGYKDFVGHDLQSDREEHWCTNGVTHLRESHDDYLSDWLNYEISFMVSGVSNTVFSERGEERICLLCKRTVETRDSHSRWYCQMCSCRDGYDTHVAPGYDCQYVLTGEDEHGVTWSGGCYCPACTSGKGACVCCYPKENDGETLKIRDPQLGVVRFGFEVYVAIVDGDDPVYEILPDALAGAFGGWPSLTTVKFNYCTNVGDRALMYCFTNCPALSDVQFASLSKAGVRAFDHAFSSTMTRPVTNIETEVEWAWDEDAQDYGFVTNNYEHIDDVPVGNAMTNIAFPSLATVGENAFDHAFENCLSLERASFPSLATVGAYAFNGAFQNCTNLTFVAFSNVVHAAENSFADAFARCDRLSVVEFPNLETAELYAFGYPWRWCGQSSHELVLPKLRSAARASLKVNYKAGHGANAIIDIRLPDIIAGNLDNRAFASRIDASNDHGYGYVRNLYIPKITKAEASSRDYFGTDTGSVLHCKDGDLTVPAR